MRKSIEILEEKLVRATKLEIARLSQQIIKDPELNRMLTSPMDDIPQYHYLYSGTVSDFRKHCLWDALQLFAYEGRMNFYFSKIGYDFTGFVVYEDNGKVINHIKMASFKDDQLRANPLLAKDLIEFVLDMASQRDFIEWLVDPENKKAIRQYDAILNRKGLNWKSTPSGGMIKYVVQGFKT